MGFLLHDPAPSAAGDSRNKSSGSDDHDAPIDEEPAQAVPKRQLQIPCIHKVFEEVAGSPVPVLLEWPYTRQMNVDGFMAEFNRAEKS